MNNFILNNTNSEVDLGIIKLISKVDSKLPLDFTTSGTTGEPKIIIQPYNNIIKNIKIKEEFQGCIWGLTYHYSKIAASQVILQAYLNGGKIVNLFNKNKHEVVKLMEGMNVTHISATPTFYRLLTNFVFSKVKQVTLGGEIVDKLIINHVKNIFPNSKISNVYALTEFGTLFSSNDDLFYISDSKAKTIRIENNHIFVKFQDEWFDTGDVVEFQNEKKFRIVGRESCMINVGGFKINPVKIEFIINNLDYVKNSKVYGLDNSVIGKVVVADIVLNRSIDKKEIIKYLKQNLNKYEIPLKINIVEEIKTNLTGKILRN